MSDEFYSAEDVTMQGRKMKKHFLIFGLLGPALWYPALTLWDGVPTSVMDNLTLYWFTLPYVFAVLEVPFLLCACVNLITATSSWWLRLSAVSIAAFTMTFLAGVYIWPSLVNKDWHVLQLGLVGVVAAVICSALVKLIELRTLGK
jgi:hypothetical protein